MISQTSAFHILHLPQRYNGFSQWLLSLFCLSAGSAADAQGVGTHDSLLLSVSEQKLGRQLERRVLL